MKTAKEYMQAAETGGLTTSEKELLVQKAQAAALIEMTTGLWEVRDALLDITKRLDVVANTIADH